jgi:hypothetical protein
MRDEHRRSVRGKVKLTPPQQRMLIELLPFYTPKLSAVAVGYMTNNTFADRLERAITASEKARLIEGRVIAQVMNSRPLLRGYRAKRLLKRLLKFRTYLCGSFWPQLSTNR